MMVEENLTNDGHREVVKPQNKHDTLCICTNEKEKNNYWTPLFDVTTLNKSSLCELTVGKVLY